MADVAFEVLADGTKEKREAIELTEFDKYKKFCCFGNPRGIPCEAPMVLAIRKKYNNYFTTTGEHKRFCKYDNTSEYRRISYVDRTGQNASPEDLLDIFNREVEARGVGGPGGGGEGGPEENENGDEHNLRQIHRVPGRPRSFKDAVLTLNSLHEDEVFGGTRVGDYLIDQRSVRTHRANGFCDGAVFIPICGRTQKGRELLMGRYSFVLVDGFHFIQKADNKLFFVVNTNKAGIDKICNAVQGQKIAVLARWHRHPKEDNAYFSDFVTERCIEVFDPWHFEVD